MANEFNTVQTISDFILTFNLQAFLSENSHLSPETFLLQCKDNTKEQNWYLAEQLKLYPKAKYKLPTFTNSSCWFTGKSYEQCSSEASAKLKSILFKGGKLLDLSGGLGVDDYFFSESFKEVIGLDPDEQLNMLVRANYEKLGKKNITRITKTAEDYLQENKNNFSLIYLDADRRAGAHKSKLLETGSPDFFTLKDQLLECSDLILLKLSPMIDLDYCIEQIPFLKQIFVVSVESEVKEVLCLIEKSYQLEVKISNYFLDKNGEILASLELENPVRKSKFTFEKPTHETIFFEASAGLIKSGLDKFYASQKSLSPIHPNGYYYTGANDFPEPAYGRWFQIISKQVFSKSEFKKYLQTQKIEKANISARDFGMGSEEIKKSFGLKDGSDDYFFFGKDERNNKVFIHAQKIDKN